MQTIPLSKQDELCFEGMTPETRALIYYGLTALITDINRTERPLLPEVDEDINSPKVRTFRNNVFKAAAIRQTYLAERTPLAISLIQHFAPQD